MHSFVRNRRNLIRFIAYSPVPVEGFFRLDDMLQIFSLPENAPKPVRNWANHPFVIEYSFKEMDIAVLRDRWTSELPSSSYIPDDYFFASEYNWSKQKEILSVLSVITRHLITKEKTEHRWVLNTEDDKLTGKFAQTGYYWDGFKKLGEWFVRSDLPKICFC